MSSFGGRINSEMGGLRRLIDDPASQASMSLADSWSLGLLRSAVAHQLTGGRKQRVWLGLAHPVDRRAKVAFRRLVFATILATFGGATAIASAALGHWPKWATRAYERLIPRSSPIADGTTADSSPQRISRRSVRTPSRSQGSTRRSISRSARGCGRFFRRPEPSRASSARATRHCPETKKSS